MKELIIFAFWFAFGFMGEEVFAAMDEYGFKEKEGVKNGTMGLYLGNGKIFIIRGRF